MEVQIIWLLVVSLGVLVNIILVLVQKKKTNTNNPIDIGVFYNEWKEFKLDFRFWKSETNKAIEDLEESLERLKRRK